MNGGEGEHIRAPCRKERASEIRSQNRYHSATQHPAWSYSVLASSSEVVQKAFTNLTLSERYVGIGISVSILAPMKALIKVASSMNFKIQTKERTSVSPAITGRVRTPQQEPEGGEGRGGNRRACNSMSRSLVRICCVFRPFFCLCSIHFTRALLAFWVSVPQFARTDMTCWLARYDDDGEERSLGSDLDASATSEPQTHHGLM